MSIKKPYQELINLLEENKNLKVSAILDKVIELASTKQSQTNTLKDDNGKITHIFCYYHKKWEEVKHFGAKKSHHTGYNTMCKFGVNQWTKQQRTAKTNRENILNLVATGKIEASEINEKLAEIEAERIETILPRPDKHGFDTIEEIE